MLFYFGGYFCFRFLSFIVISDFHKSRVKGKFSVGHCIENTSATRFVLFDNAIVIGNLTCSVSAALSGALCLNYPHLSIHIFAAATSHFPMRGEHTVGVSSY